MQLIPEPTPSRPPLRRRKGQIRFGGARRTLLDFPVRPDIERRKKRAAGFDVAAALELNVDRFPSQEEMLALLQRWLSAAEREEGFVSRWPNYVFTLRSAINVMKRARHPDEAIQFLQET